MKKSILLVGWLLAAAPATFGQTHYLENLLLANQQVTKTGDKVILSTDIRIDDMQLKRQQAIRLVPVLVSADGTQHKELSPIWIEGSVRSKVNDRKRTLGILSETDESLCIKRKNGTTQTVTYQAEVPFSNWMVNGRLELRGYVTGCAECSEGNEVLAAGYVLPYREPDFVMAAAMKPAEETVKRRAENRTARLEYQRASYAVLPNYRTNRTELDNVQQSLNLVKENPNLTITGIYITGYASPEGSMTYNEKLSQRRAQTFADYVQKNNKELKKELWHVAWKGEDWEGFVSQVDKANGWSAQAVVKEAIAQCNDNIDACEWKIRQQLSAEDYRYLVDELYAPLRRNDYRIEYTVRNFTPEEARQILKTRPDLLSAAEMQRVADSYGINTKDYREALSTALRIYPDNTALRYNAALAAIETRQYAEAIDLLKDSQEGAFLNLLGLVHYKNGNKRLAEETFKKAVAAGYTEAEQNAEGSRLAIEMLGE